MNLSNPSELKEILGRHGFSIYKSLGQNFLIDRQVLDKIMIAANIDKYTNVLEIGAGAGTLTRELAQNSKRAVSVEIDKALMPILAETTAEFENFKLINEDIMKIDIPALAREEFDGEPFSVTANLPYYITTPIVMNLLESGAPVKNLTLMVQREVADRMAAREGTKEYGALSVAVQFYTKPEIICKAEPHCFLPQPKVASTVINLSVLDSPAVQVTDQPLFFKIVKSAFGQRRKTFVNALSGSPYLTIGKDAVLEALNALELNPAIRGEKLSLAQFAQLTEKLSGCC